MLPINIVYWLNYEKILIVNARYYDVMAIRTLPTKELLGLGFDVMVAALFVTIIGGGSVYMGMGFTSEGDNALGGIFLAIGIVILLAGMIGVQIKLIADSVSAAIYLNTDLLNIGKNINKDTHVFPVGFENLTNK